MISLEDKCDVFVPLIQEFTLKKWWDKFKN